MREESMKSQNQTTTQQHAVDFMIAEYETLRNLRQDLITLGENRLNFFLASVSGAAVFVALISQLSTYQEIVLFVVGVVTLFLRKSSRFLFNDANRGHF